MPPICHVPKATNKPRAYWRGVTTRGRIFASLRFYREGAGLYPAGGAGREPRIRLLPIPAGGRASKLYLRAFRLQPGRTEYRPAKPGGRHPLFAHGTQTTNCFARPSSVPISATALSVDTDLLQAAHVTTRFLFSLALSLGIDCLSHPQGIRRELSFWKHAA
jgi:hypothetical protein